MFLRFQRIALDVSYGFGQYSPLFLIFVFLIKKRVRPRGQDEILNPPHIHATDYTRFGYKNSTKNVALFRNKMSSIYYYHCIYLLIMGIIKWWSKALIPITVVYYPMIIHSFFIRTLYKNIEPENGPKIKNNPRTGSASKRLKNIKLNQ